MPRTAKAPKGFYSATEAIKLLGLPRATFFNMVKTGKIKKVVSPGMKDGYYPKAAIDDMVKARELFTIEYATDTTTFERATEDDIQGIYNLCISLWGTRGTYPYEQRLARYKKNPNIFYVLKYVDIVVGFSTIMPITKRAVDEILATGKPGYEVITLDDILPFTPGKPIEYAFLEIAVRDGVPKPKQYAVHLISGTCRVLDDFAREGVVIKKFFAMSRTSDGIGISRKLGFEETPLPPHGEALAFILDIEKASAPLLHTYQQIVKDRHQDVNNM